MSLLHSFAILAPVSRLARSASRSVAVLLMASTAVAAPLGPGTPTDLLDPPQGRFMDEWAEVHLAGGKVGYAHSTMAREGDLIHTGNTTMMKMGRVDQPVKISIVQTTTESLEGTPLRFSTVMDASIVKSTTSGVISDARITITSSQYGVEQSQVFDFVKGSLMTWGAYREGLLRGFKPGTEYTIPMLITELRMDGPIDAVTQIGDFEQIEHHGRTVRAQKVVVALRAPAGDIAMTTWVDDVGRPLRAEVPAPGLGNMVLIATDQASALADFVPPEIFTTTTIKAGRKIDAKRTKRIKYRLSATAPGVDLDGFPNTDMQSVKKNADGSIEITVTRRPHRPTGPASKPATAKSAAKETREDLSEYLESNLMINTADPELVKLAKKAGGKEKNPFALGDRLRRFVTEYISSKTLNVAFATASEVCRTREGDCSEHGVLLAALGRINGLPARVAVGLAYVPRMGRQKDIFGYHMWTQFHIDGRWIDFDAALRESQCSPIRIAFAVSSLKNAGMADLSLPLLSKIGVIDIDILEVEKISSADD